MENIIIGLSKFDDSSTYELLVYYKIASVNNIAAIIKYVKKKARKKNRKERKMRKEEVNTIRDFVHKQMPRT